MCVCVIADPPHIPTDDTSAEDFRDLLNLNLISYFLAAKVTFVFLSGFLKAQCVRCSGL